MSVHPLLPALVASIATAPSNELAPRVRRLVAAYRPADNRPLSGPLAELLQLADEAEALTGARRP